MRLSPGGGGARRVGLPSPGSRTRLVIPAARGRRLGRGGARRGIPRRPGCAACGGGDWTRSPRAEVRRIGSRRIPVPDSERMRSPRAEVRLTAPRPGRAEDTGSRRTRGGRVRPRAEPCSAVSGPASALASVVCKCRKARRRTRRRRSAAEARGRLWTAAEDERIRRAARATRDEGLTVIVAGDIGRAARLANLAGELGRSVATVRKRAQRIGEPSYLRHSRGRIRGDTMRDILKITVGVALGLLLGGGAAVGYSAWMDARAEALEREARRAVAAMDAAAAAWTALSRWERGRMELASQAWKTGVSWSEAAAARRAGRPWSTETFADWRALAVAIAGPQRTAPTDMEVAFLAAARSAADGWGLVMLRAEAAGQTEAAASAAARYHRWTAEIDRAGF